MRSRSLVPTLLAAGLLAAGLAPAAADWLVTREGGRVETRGSWKEKGKLVVFTTAGGALSSLRLAEVDLAASRQATADAERARVEAAEVRQRPPAPRTQVRSITDKDVSHVGEAAASAAAPEEDAEGAADGQDAAPRADLDVTSWERASAGEDGHVAVTGKLRNLSNLVITDIRLTVQLLDETGEEIANVPADLTARALKAGGQASFVADFPDVYSFATARLVPRGVRLAAPRPAPEPEAESEGSAADFAEGGPEGL